MLDRADCADFGCHNSIRLETKHFLNTLALTFISFSGRFVFATQKHYLFFCERSSSCYFFSAFFTGIKFIVVTDPRAGSQEVFLKKMHEVYADYALKNPFYSIDMPIR